MNFKRLITKHFTISYTKVKYIKFEEGACFLIEGCIKTEEGWKSAAKFIGEAVGDSTFTDNARLIKTSFDSRCDVTSSALLSVTLDALLPHLEGFDDGWIKD
jgi:hypothetical protein